MDREFLCSFPVHNGGHQYKSKQENGHIFQKQLAHHTQKQQIYAFSRKMVFFRELFAKYRQTDHQNQQHKNTTNNKVGKAGYPAVGLPPDPAVHR